MAAISPIASSILPQLHASELSTLIPLSSIWDHFQCSICLEEIKNAVLLKECSHSFCDNCIRECLNRKHQCPLCQSDATIDSIIKNNALNQLCHSIKIAQREAAAKITKKLLPKGTGGVVTATSSLIDPSSDLPPNHALLLGRMESSQMPLSPMESLFRTHVTGKLLLPWEATWQELQTRRNEEEAKIRANAGGAAAASASSSSVVEAASVSSAPGGPSNLIDSSLVSSAAFYTRASSTLISSYEQFLSNLPPPAFLEPMPCTIILQPNIPPGDGSTSNLQLRLNVFAWEDLTQLSNKIISESKKSEIPSHWALRNLSFTPNYPNLNQPEISATSSSSLSVILTGVQPVSMANNMIAPLPLQLNLNISDITRPFCELFHSNSSGNGGGANLFLTIKGNFEFICAPMKPRCFIALYQPNMEDQRMDYFKCQQCALNCKKTFYTHVGISHFHLCALVNQQTEKKERKMICDEVVAHFSCCFE
jgi:hypothetical protein